MRFEVALAETPGVTASLHLAGAEPSLSAAHLALTRLHPVRSAGKTGWALPPKGFVDAIGLDAGPPLLLHAELPRYRQWRFHMMLSVIDPAALADPMRRSYACDLALIAGTTTPDGLDEALRWLALLTSDLQAARTTPVPRGVVQLPEVPIAFLLDDSVAGSGPRPRSLGGYPVHPITDDGVGRAFRDALAATRNATIENELAFLAGTPGGGAAHHSTFEDPVARDLHRAILDDPFVDAPRSALGDLLQSRDDPRGEHIALQLQIAAEVRRGMTPSVETRERAKSLLVQHRVSWEQELAGWCTVQRFGRGFVESMVLSPSQWLFGHAVIRSRAPVVALRIDAADRFEELAAHPSLDGIIALSVANVPIGDRGIVAITRSSHLRRLRYLDVSGCGVGPHARETLTAELPALRWLRVDREDPLPVLAEVVPVVDGP